MNQNDVYLKVNKKDIILICNFLESFEGMMALRTPNPDKFSDKSIIHIMVSPDYQEQFETILNNFKKSISIEEIKKYDV